MSIRTKARRPPVHKSVAAKSRAKAGDTEKAAKTAERFSPLVREPAYTQVSAAIEAKIMKRELRDGDVLPAESDLAQQFVVHRSTVREALRRLESSGLIARPPGAKRMIVSRPPVQNFAAGMHRVMVLHDVTFVEVWESMMVIEPEVAALAATRRTAEQLELLARLAEEFTASAVDEEAAQKVARFFETLGDCAGNQVLILAKRPLAQALAPSLARMIGKIPQARKRIVEAQRSIITALRLKDAEDARRWMLKHVRDFKRGYELAKISADERISF